MSAHSTSSTHSNVDLGPAQDSRALLRAERAARRAHIAPPPRRSRRRNPAALPRTLPETPATSEVHAGTLTAQGPSSDSSSQSPISITYQLSRDEDRGTSDVATSNAPPELSAPISQARGVHDATDPDSMRETGLSREVAPPATHPSMHCSAEEQDAEPEGQGRITSSMSVTVSPQPRCTDSSDPSIAVRPMERCSSSDSSPPRPSRTPGLGDSRLSTSVELSRPSAVPIASLPAPSAHQLTHANAAPSLPSNVAFIGHGEHFRKPSGNLMLAHRRAITMTRQSPAPLSMPSATSSRHASPSLTPVATPSPVVSTVSVQEDEPMIFDEEAGTVTGVPPARRRQRRSAPTSVNTDVVAFLENRYPSRMRRAAEMRARSKAQTGAGYKNNILVRLILSTYTDLALGTNKTDVKSQEYDIGDRWLSVSTEDIVLAFGMAVNTFSTTRSHVELCYRVRQWMIDNPRQWNTTDDDGDDKRLFDMLEAYCRRGILPPITSPEASQLSRAERDALLCGGRTMYEAVAEFMEGKETARNRVQAMPVVYEPEE